MADTIPVIWGQTSDGKDAYVKTCTAGVYNPETGKPISEEMVTMQASPAVITGETPIKPVCDALGNVICPQTRTEAVYDPESGQTLDKVLKEEKLKLLWTNPAPTATFGAQTLSLDLTKYDLINVLTTTNINSNYLQNHIFVKLPDTYQTVVDFLGSQKTHRNLKVSNSGIEFTVNTKYSAYQSETMGTTDNALNRPIYIYGIKL